MANPNSLDLGTAVIETDSNGGSITLNPQRTYQITHTSQDGTGGADTALIDFSTSSATTAVKDTGSNLARLTTTMPLYVGPGISYLGFLSQANNPAFCISSVEYANGRF